MKMLKLIGMRGGGRFCALISAIVALSAARCAFAEDAYIQSYGAQSVNTGYHASGKTKVSIDFQLTQVKNNNDCVFGHYATAGEFCLLVYCPGETAIYAEAHDGAHAGGNDPRLHAWDAETDTQSSSWAKSDTERHVVVIDAPGKKADMYAPDGTHQAHLDFPSGWTYAKTSKFPMIFFGASKDANGTAQQRVYAKIYRVKVWETENGETSLVHDYVPAEKYGYAGFYDTVDGQFFGRQETSGTLLTYGGDNVMSLGDAPYIENDGSAYSAIDTRYFPNNRTKVEVDFQETEIVSGDCVFGHYASDYTLLIYRPTSDGHYWLVAKDGTYSGCALSPQVSSDTRRHTAVIDIPNRHVEMRAPDGGIQGSAELSSKTEWSWNFSTVNNPLMMFGHSTDAYGNSNQRVKARIYGVRIYENANSDGSGKWTKVHDFTPYLRKGVPGFKDTVTGKYVSGGNIVAGGNPPEEDDTDPYIDTGTDNLVMSFDTGYYVSSNTCIVCDYMPLKQKAEQQFVFEAGDGTSANNSGKMYMRLYANGNAGNGGISYACGSDQYVVIHPDGTPANGKQIWFAPNVRRTVTLDAYHGKVEMAMNGERVSTKALAATSRLPDKSASTLKIFSSSGGGDHAAMARLYSFQIYEEDALVRDYRPYVKNGLVGLKDVEGDGGFITASANVGELKCGGAIEMEGISDAYIQNDGTTILDLGYRASMKTRVEYDFQNLLLGQNKVFFGAWSGNNIGNLRYCCWNENGEIKFIFSGNTGGTQNPTGIRTDYGRHTAIMDMKNRALAFVTDGVTNNVAVKGTFSADGKDESLLNMGAFAALTGGMVSKSRIYAVRIYEDNVLIHEFLPYKNGDTVSLYDTKTGNVATKATASMSWPTIGGKGVDGGEKWIVEPQAAVTLTKTGEPKTIIANAAGAVSYKWTKNDEAIEGVANGELTVSWEKRRTGNTVDKYTVTPVYNVFGLEVDGEPKTVEVTNAPLGLMVILR